jgi:hypothetical protein
MKISLQIGGSGKVLEEQLEGNLYKSGIEEFDGIFAMPSIISPNYSLALELTA